MAGDIIRTQAQNRYSYETVEGRRALPITYVSWYSAARYCNWLHHDQPIGEQDENTTEDGSYTLFPDIETIAPACMEKIAPINIGARYFLPSVNQWYKAAYYTGGGIEGAYVTTQQEGHYGTLDMSGPLYTIADWSSSPDIFGYSVMCCMILTQNNKDDTDSPSRGLTRKDRPPLS